MVELPVHIHGGRIDLHQAVRRDVHELRNIHGAIGRGRVVDQNRRAVVARPRRCGSDTSACKATGLFEENTSQRPLGEKLCQEFIRDMLASHPPRLAARRRHDVKLAVGPHQLAVAASTNTIQRPSGETLGKVLLMPLPEAPAIGSALPPLPSLKGTR